VHYKRDYFQRQVLHPYSQHADCFCISRHFEFYCSLLLFQFLRALVIPFSIVISFYQFRTLPSPKAGNWFMFRAIAFFEYFDSYNTLQLPVQSDSPF
jgi:hypothetical protein